ncbi:MAG: methyltransferase domain-containing protein [Candidatus Omnitrophica bacterium]|nr:methyltransferase domain-containing protein [Candidatus Omnitrophota bacterium]
MMRAEHLAQLDAIDQTYWWHRVRWRAVRRSLHRTARRRAFSGYFDIGSGGGGLPGLLVNDFAFTEIRLFDQHEVQGSKINHPRVTQHAVDLERFQADGLPAPELVTCLDVLEHLRDPAQLLRELRRCAAGRTSTLIVTVPAMRSVWSWWDELAGHHRRYTRRELERLLEDAGWRVVYCRYFFHAAVVPLWLRHRWRAGGGSKRLEFPRLPGWLNGWLERAFWLEYLATDWFPLPFGSSLIAVARVVG